MKCPFCDSDEDKVIESRPLNDGEAVRRRRECLKCQGRFTSYERIEIRPIFVIKKDNRREPFDREKLMKGITISVQKRPISMDQIETIVDNIEKNISTTDREFESVELGKMVMNELERLDPVAYVRFASVYREFKSVKEFVEEIETIFNDKNNKRTAKKVESKKSH